MTLPGADELFFRPSEPAAPEPAPPEPEPPAARPAGASGGARPVPRARPARPPRPSGRQRHDEKITVYISAPELLALEQTRLTLRGDHGITADRGRIVREAVAVLLADFEEHGASSMLVRRLSET
ncbi:hypothetical protein LG943_24370 [Streptomonospora sp. S1-112]|uniref:Cobyrinic acid a,c-diamide synthase n=1 Tax=Streptomonospora mangrovi TaxID=2883123 RepID=A0A9X3SG09_9ACTN|nr:hypothetical protein [Streptomonospora mangrovi]MDA0567433.1 hypothetical protein [Streptomonospora mangrovi]